MNQSNNETSNNKNKKVSLKNFAIFGAIAFALIATLIPAYSYVTAFENNAGSGGSGGDGGSGGHGGLTGLNDALGGDGGAGGAGGEGGTGGDGGSDNTAVIIDDYEAVATSEDEAVDPFVAALEASGLDVDGAVDADGGDADGGAGGNGGEGGLAAIESGDADGGDAGDGGSGAKGGDAIAICNTLGCI